MEIDIPPRWRTTISSWRWVILVWTIDIGAILLGVIDTLLGWLNWLVTQTENAWNKAAEAWDKAVEIFRDLSDAINREADRLWNNIETWWDELGEWWQVKKQWVKGQIGEAGDTLKGLIDDAQKGLDKLGAAWDNFWATTWPQLLKDFNALLVKTGNFFSGILPGLATHEEVDKAIADERLTWKDLLDFFTSFSRAVVAFFTDPLDWLLEKFTDWFLGPEA